MAMASISFPFRIDPVSRRVATNPDGSDPEANEAIALHVMTQPGERPMRPGFGIDSMSFGDGLEAGTLQLQLTEHGWANLAVIDIETSTPENGRVESVVSWQRSM